MAKCLEAEQVQLRSGHEPLKVIRPATRCAERAHRLARFGVEKVTTGGTLSLSGDPSGYSHARRPQPGAVAEERRQ